MKVGLRPELGAVDGLSKLFRRIVNKAAEGSHLSRSIGKGFVAYLLGTGQQVVASLCERAGLKILCEVTGKK